MTLKPFPVRHTDPKFVIIEFFDNSLSAQIEPDLAAMASAAATDLAVLAVTDSLFRPAQVIEVTTNTRAIIEDLGKIDTGDQQLIANLLARALISYPNAKHVAIGFSGHGSGVFDDIDPKLHLRLFPWLRPPRFPSSFAAGDTFFAAYSVLFDRAGGLLTNAEVKAMLRDAFAAAGRGNNQPVDLIFFDTCLNGMIEVVTEIEEFANCIVGSADLQPPTGWDYGEWLRRLKSSPPTDGITWGRHAVEAMKAAYDGRLADFPVTLSAIHARSSVAQRFADLVREAERAKLDGFRYLDWARSQAQDYGDRIVDSFDLLDFACHLSSQREIEDIAVAADAVIVAVKNAVAHSIALGPANAHGMAFWFPAQRSAFLRDVGTYRQLSFDKQTGWSSYLDTFR